MINKPSSSDLLSRLLLLAALSLAACGLPEGTSSSGIESTSQRQGTGTSGAETAGEESAAAVGEEETTESMSSMVAACLKVGTCTNDRKKCCSTRVTRNRSCSTTFSCCAPSGTWVHSKSDCCSGLSGPPDGHHNVKCY